MSFSRRQSKWANSAIVVTVGPEDWAPFCPPDVPKALAGVYFQRAMERRAAELGGGGLTVPVQRLTDFLERKPSPDDDLPTSSYRLGVKAAPVHELYPVCSLPHKMFRSPTSHRPVRATIRMLLRPMVPALMFGQRCIAQKLVCYPMLRYALLCHRGPHYAIRCYTMLCHGDMLWLVGMPCCDMPCYAMAHLLSSVVLCYGSCAKLCCAVLYHAMLCTAPSPRKHCRAVRRLGNAYQLCYPQDSR